MDSLVVIVRLPSAPCDDCVPHAPSPQTSSADEGASDADDRPPVPPPTAKKRKPTYEVRKEEIAAKQNEVVALRAELHRLKLAQLRDHHQRTDPLYANATMHSLVQQNRLTIASAQSLISSYSAQYETPPLSTYIHLPSDVSERQRILQGLKAQKIHEALAFMVARVQFTDLTRSGRQLEDFETETGDNVLVHWEVARITEPGATVEAIFDEMLYFKATLEMTLTEKLGILMVRESDSCDDTSDTTQVRIVSTHTRGLEVEKNVVLYAQYFSPSSLLDQPHALMVTDYVDRDDLFPYQTHCRIRKDVSSATLVLPCPPAPGKAPAIAVVKWTFVRIHHSPLATPDELEMISRDGVRSFFDVMLKTVRERLTWRT